MDKTEKLKLENQIKELKEKLNDLETTVDNIKEEEEGEWKPREGEQYHYIDKIGCIKYSIWHCDWLDNALFELGNVFKTIEEAGKEAKITKVRAKLKRLSNKSMHGKALLRGLPFWYIVMYTNGYTICPVATSDDVAYNPYPFSTKEDAQIAIKGIGEENLKLYFGIED